MTDEFDFLDSTPPAVPYTGDHEEHVEEHVEEVTVEGDAVDVEGENVTVHEEIIEEPQSFKDSPLRYVVVFCLHNTQALAITHSRLPSKGTDQLHVQRISNQTRRIFARKGF
jgi:hypothetical protein